MTNKIPKVFKPKITKKGVLAKKTGPKGVRKHFTDDDLDKLIKLMAMYATIKDIEGFFAMSIDTITRRLKSRGIKFAELHEKKRVLTRSKVRVAMLEKIEAGDVAMTIFAAKNWLGMSDKQDIRQEVSIVKPEIYKLPDNSRGDVE